jgi:hypothetical protein
LVGGNEIAGADADGFDEGIRGRDEVGLLEAGIKLSDVGLGFGESAFAGFNILTAEALVHEAVGVERLLGTGLGGVNVLRAGASLQKCEFLAGGFCELRGVVTLRCEAVKLLMGDDVLLGERLHAVVGGGGVDGIGFRGGVVGLGLMEFLWAGAVVGFLKEGLLLMERGIRLGDLFGTVAALEPVVVRSSLIDGGLGLSELGVELVGFEGDEGSVGWDLLALFDANGGNAAADLGADLDLASFDGAGVGEGSGAAAEIVVKERGDDGYDDDREDDLLTLLGSSDLLGAVFAERGFCKWHTERL